MLNRVLIVIVIGCVVCAITEAAPASPFTANKKVDAYEKRYGTVLGTHARDVLLKQSAEFDAYNAQVAKRNRETGEDEARMGNGFAHLSNEEFKETFGLNAMAQYARLNPLPSAAAPPNSHSKRLQPKERTLWARLASIFKREETTAADVEPNPSRFSTMANPPAAFTWNKTATFNTVWGTINQGSCGSCWAVSAAEALHSSHVIRHSQTDAVPPSSQQLLDCAPGNFGCGGGWAYKAFDYIIAKGGIASSTDYPYIGVGGNCTYEPVPGFMGVVSYIVVPWKDPTALINAVLVSPVVVTVCGSTPYFQHYAGGVMTNATACTECTDHSVMLVGYGTVGTTKVWIIQNSWGPNWGIGGFAYLLRLTTTGEMGMCGITRYSTRPLARL